MYNPLVFTSQVLQVGTSTPANDSIFLIAQNSVRH